MSVFSHSVLRWCIWDLPALILMAVMAAVLAVQCYKGKRRKKNFEKERKEQQ